MFEWLRRIFGKPSIIHFPQVGLENIENELEVEEPMELDKHGANIENLEITRVHGICPHCGVDGEFKPFDGRTLVKIPWTLQQIKYSPKIIRASYAGITICHKPTCNGVFYFVCDIELEQKQHYNAYGRLSGKSHESMVIPNFIETYPPPKLKIDIPNLPNEISEVFNEANTCFTNKTFNACAALLRKTLERFIYTIEIPEEWDRYINQNGQQKRRQDTLGNRLNWMRANIGHNTFLTIDERSVEFFLDVKDFGNDAVHRENSKFKTVSSASCKTAFEGLSEELRSYYAKLTRNTIMDEHRL